MDVFSSITLLLDIVISTGGNRNSIKTKSFLIRLNLIGEILVWRKFDEIGIQNKKIARQVIKVNAKSIKNPKKYCASLYQHQNFSA